MIILGKTKHEWQQLELQYRPEWIIFLVGFILGAIIFQMNKQLQLKNTSYFARSKQQNLRELARLTFLNLMSANGVMAKTIIRNYKQRQQREIYENNINKSKWLQFYF